MSTLPMIHKIEEQAAEIAALRSRCEAAEAEVARLNRYMNSDEVLVKFNAMRRERDAAEARDREARAALRDVSQALHSDGTMCWCVYERMIHPQDDPQDALPLEENGHHKSCNRARRVLGAEPREGTK